MQDGIRRSPQHRNHDHGVLKRRTCHDISRLEIKFKQATHGFAGLDTLINLDLLSRRIGSAIWQRHPHCLNRSCHCVRRVHTAATTSARASIQDDFLTLLIINCFCKILTITLKRTYDINYLALGLARFDRAAINHQGRPVDSGHGHHHPWHVLVTTWNGH